MRQKAILLIVGLLLSAMPMMGAYVTNNPEHLVFGKKWIEGACQVNLVCCLHVEVTNTGNVDYQGFWDVINTKTGKSLLESTDGGFMIMEGLYNGEVNVPAGETKEVRIHFLFDKLGSYELSIVSPDVKLFDYSIDIGEHVTPKVKGSLQVDMLERTDDGNILYGDPAHFRITGKATLTNEDENTVFAWGGFMIGAGSGIQVVVSNQLFRPYVAYENLFHLVDELKSGQTITKDFEFEFNAAPEDGKGYSIYLNVLDNEVAIVRFKVKQCTNTYWTSDGHVKPLPVEADNVLKVPKEALTVDLRGFRDMSTLYSIDVSEANPNCLYFLGYLDHVPKGITSTTNVIRDYEAKDIIINSNYDYYCPMPFKTKLALFTYTPVSEAMGPASPIMSQIMSSAFILPFDAQEGRLIWTNGDMESGFYNDQLKVYSCVGAMAGMPMFCPVSEPLTAYTPYLMYVMPSPVDFYAENITVPVTRETAVTIDMGGQELFKLTASTKEETVNNGTYLWSCDNYNFYHSERTSQVRPFNVVLNLLQDNGGAIDDPHTTEAASDSNSPKVIQIFRSESSLIPDATALQTANTRKYDRLAVYSLSGQHVGTATFTNGKIKAEGLKPGLYVANGMKFVVR